MRCQIIRRHLDMYCAGEIQLKLHVKVENHLQACDDCRKALRRQNTIAAIFRQLPTPSVPADFAKRIVEAARAGTPKYFEANRKTQYLIRLSSDFSMSMRAAAAVVLVAGLIMGFLIGRDTWRQTAMKAVFDVQITQRSSAAYGLDCLMEGAEGSLVSNYLNLAVGQNEGQD